MRRGAFEILRRGLDNAIANWQLVALRFGETMLFGFLAVVTAVAMIVPTLVTLGIALSDLKNPEDLLSVATSLMSKWVVLLWIAVAVLMLLVLFVALHAFVEAGRARQLVDGERAAGPGDGPRSRFTVFSFREWLAHAAAGWWPLFWMYNAAWSAAALILFIPLLPTLILMVLFYERPAIAVSMGCLGLLLTVFLGIVVGVITAMWTTRAVAEWGLRGRTAREALSAGWRAMRADFGRHFLVALAAIVVGLAGSAFFASFSFFASFGEAFGQSGVFNLITLPIRLAGSILSSLFSAAVSTWYLASYAALAVEGEGGKTVGG